MPVIEAGFQVGCAAVGLVVMNPLPAPTATHRLVEEQLTALSALVVMNALAQSGSAAVGLWETSACPLPSTATHRLADRQLIATSTVESSMFEVAHVGFAAVGSVETNASPTPSTATHSEVEGQETA